MKIRPTGRCEWFDRWRDFRRDARQGDRLVEARVKIAEYYFENGKTRDATKFYEQAVKEFKSRGLAPASRAGYWAAKARFTLVEQTLKGYLTLMNHWEQLYPGQVMHLSYEDLANNPDKKITDILEYCGLPVEEGCFRFYESDRPVLTPSAGQVRSPISTKSIGSGQRYEKYIKTSIPALAEIKRKSKEVFDL